MGIENLRPELQDSFKKIPSLPFHIKPLIPIARFIYNIAAKSKLDDGVEVRTERHGAFEMRVFTPKFAKSDAGVLWCFGGGHVAGNADHVNGIANHICKKTGATVFAPAYRLAPRHPFPANLDDAFNCWTHIVSNAASYGVNPDKLAIGGNSAGGGLAASLAQRILDEGGPQPKAQILFYPMLDDRTAADHSKDALGTVIWQNKANRTAWGVYLSPHAPGAATLPDYAAPARRQDLSSLPPTWIGFGDVDLFANEDQIYAQRLKDAKVECEVEFVPGAPHAFEAICPDVPVSIDFVASAMEFLVQRIGSASAT
ncbi:alpha/beta hydrolase [Ruegeria jejuensis]|uniref:alpha/beta hydrolase n=1 Tax=Ruegeria jejuensis TaxID=3233338 RepID=UPI00355BE2E3